MQLADRRERVAHSGVLLRTVPAALAAGAAAFAIWFAVRPSDDFGGDLPVYEEYASIILGGKVPYRDFWIEYPPGALPMFVVPAVALGDARDASWSPPDDDGRRYHRAFDSLVVLLTAAMLALTALSLAALRRPMRAQVLPLAVVASAPLLIGHVFLARYDVWPAALTAAAVAAALRGRHGLAGTALGLGVTAKIYPALLLPVLLIAAARHRGARAAVVTGASAFGAFAAVMLPFALASWSATWAHLRLQFGGGLHTETLASSVLVMSSHIADAVGAPGLPLPTELAIRPEEGGVTRSVLAGPGVDATVTAMNVLLAGVLCLLWVGLARSKADPREDLVRYAAASVAAALALGTVLSAQYVTWLIPLVPLIAGRRGTAATLCLAAVALLTHVWFPSDAYGSYHRDFDPGATALLLARNLALLALLLALALAVPRRPRFSVGNRKAAVSSGFLRLRG